MLGYCSSYRYLYIIYYNIFKCEIKVQVKKWYDNMAAFFLALSLETSL